MTGIVNRSEAAAGSLAGLAFTHRHLCGAAAGQLLLGTKRIFHTLFNLNSQYPDTIFGLHG
jgi:hypothetical protein